MAARKSGKAPQEHHRNEQLSRVLEMLKQLSRLGGADLQELATQFGTTTRTIRRDLDAIEAAGLKLDSELAEDGNKKRWFLADESLAKVTKQSGFAHWLGLKLVLDQADLLAKDSPYFVALEDITQQVEQALGPKARQRLMEMDRCFFDWEKFAWQSLGPSTLQPIIECIVGKRLAKVKYKSAAAAARAKEFEVLPLRLFKFQGSVYLHAWVPKHQNVLTLNLRRLQSLVPTDTHAEPPASYDTRAFEASAFGVFTGPHDVTYSLRFSATAAPYILERTWHPTQKVTARPDGGVDLTFTCAESYEVGSWVANWRWDVEVLGPPSLRAEMGRLRDHLAQAYPA